MSHPYHVLVVSPDRVLLRQAAFVLEEFGVTTTSCASHERATLAIANEPFDFVLLDADADGHWQAVAKAKPLGAHLHVLLLCDPHAHDAGEAFQLGADDFLHKPLDAGELLTRLRAAARYAEFERRIREQHWEDPVTLLASRQALLDHLGDELHGGAVAKKPVLVMAAIDHFSGFRRQRGDEAANAALKIAAEAVAEQAIGARVVARLEDAFAILPAEHALDKAVKLADKLRAALAEASPADLEHAWTASVGIAAATGKQETAEGLLSRARGALRDAQRSGGDCSVTTGQFDQEAKTWIELVRKGNPFAASVARDLMTPLPLELRGADTSAYAVALLSQTRLELLPVVDMHKRLIGVVEFEQLGGQAQPSAQPVEQVMTKPVATVPENATFETVLELFARDHKAHLVVLTGEHAAGYISRERFLNLVNPLDRGLFSTGVFSSGTEYLVVPDVMEAEAL